MCRPVGILLQARGARLRHGFAALTLATCALAAPARADEPARAATPAEQATGRTLFNEAQKLYAEGKFAQACTKLEASLKAFPGLGTRGKLAECYEKIGRFTSAWATYRDVARLAARANDTARERVASERAKALEPKMSSLTIAVSPERDVPGLTVKRNGVIVPRAEYGRAFPLDASTVVLEITAPDHQLFSAEVKVLVGQTASFEVPRLEPIVVPVAEAPPPPVNAAPTPPEAYRPAENARHVSWQKPVGLTVLGLGIATAAVGGFFGISARSTYDDAFDRGDCERGTNLCNAAGLASTDSASSKAAASTILLIGGGALAAGGLVLFFTAPSRARSAAGLDRLEVAPTTFVGGGGLTVRGAL